MQQQIEFYVHFGEHIYDYTGENFATGNNLQVEQMAKSNWNEYKCFANHGGQHMFICQ